MRALRLLVPLLALLGCAETRTSYREETYVHGSLPPPPSERLRSGLGEVWIDSILAEPSVQFVTTPAIGKWSGLGRGAAAGAVVGCVVLGWPALMSGIGWLVIGALGCTAGATVGSIAGAGYGAVAAEPKASAEKAMSVIRATLGSHAPQQQLRDRVRVLTRDDAAVRLASEAGAAATRLEVEVVAIQLDGLPLPDTTDPLLSAGVINPALRLVMTAQARLIRSETGVEVYTAQLEYWGARRTVPEWARDDASALRGEIGRGTDALAEQIVDTVFLLYGGP